LKFVYGTFEPVWEITEFRNNSVHVEQIEN